MLAVNKYYTIKEAAELLGVSRSTLRNYEARGWIKAYRNPANRYRLFRAEDIRDFLRKIDESETAYE